MIEGFSVIFISIVLEAIPFVMIGALASSLIELYITSDWIAARIPRNKVLAYGMAGLMGMVFPVCECAIVPIMRRLIKKGTPVGLAVTFMLAVPIVNPVVLASTYYAFPDSNMFVLRGVFGFIGAVLVGLTLHRLSSTEILLPSSQAKLALDTCGCGHDHVIQQDLKSIGLKVLKVTDTRSGNYPLANLKKHQLTFESKAILGAQRIHGTKASDSDSLCGCGVEHIPKKDKSALTLQDLKHILGHTSTELYEVGRFLILGAFISALLQVFVPRADLLKLGSTNISSILLMMTLAFVLSLCSEADAFIASTFRYQFNTGSLLGFLIFGPMIDIKNTLMLSGAFKPKFVVRLIATISVVCFALAVLANQFGL